MVWYYACSYVACGLFSLWLVVKLIWKKITCNYGFIYCPSNVPMFGSTLYLESDSHKLYKQHEELRQAYHIYLLWISWNPTIFADKTEYAKVVLGSQVNLRKSHAYDFLHEWLNTGLLISRGLKWKHRRRLITPSYHFSILNEFVPILEKHAQGLVGKFNVAANEAKIIDVQPILSLMTLEAICETSMGIGNSIDENAVDYIESIGKIGYHIRYRAYTPLLWPHYTYILSSAGKDFYHSLNNLHNFTVNAINKRISIHAQMEQHSNGSTWHDTDDMKKKRNICFIDTLIDSYQKGDIDMEGIREEVDTFVFGGHDTTSSAISFCLYMLGLHQDYQKLLQDEIERTEGKNISEKIQKMELLDSFIKETLRLYPPASGVGRNLEEDTIIDGRTFYKGTNIVISIYGLHRNEEYWENPLEFNPYRFMRDTYKERNPYSYIPFSAGPRNCIGQKFALLEVKISLYYILRSFCVTSVQAEEDLEICTDLITYSANGILIKFEQRDQLV